MSRRRQAKQGLGLGRLLRILVLLTILLVVAGNQWLTHKRSTDWQEPLWVTIYPLAGDGARRTQRYINTLQVRDFESLNRFLLREAQRYGADLDQALVLTLAPQLKNQPPVLPAERNFLAVAWWSLRMRWWVWRVKSQSTGPAPDILIFVRYHDQTLRHTLDESIGIKKGMYGIVNAFAARSLQGRNNLVIAHELLHTLGATDKYDPVTQQPLVPAGLAEPQQRPLYPQRKAEIMGGRTALAADRAVMPESLKQVIIGTDTAQEIGLLP